MNAIDPLLVVVRRLGELRERVVFVGGMIRPLLITDPAAAFARATDDVDGIVEISSRAELYSLHEQLRARGFAEDASADAPICRWVVDHVRVDVMPTEELVLGFRNRWYSQTLGSDACSVEHVTADLRRRPASIGILTVTMLPAAEGNGAMAIPRCSLSTAGGAPVELAE